MKARVWHYIKKNHGTQSPSSVLYVDTEAAIVKKSKGKQPGEMSLDRWAATHVRYNSATPVYRKEYSGDSSVRFWDIVNLITQEKKPLWIIGHNIGFDLTLLEFWEMIESGEVTIVNACLESPPLWIEGRLESGPFKIVDSFNYFHESLDDIGAWIGTKKLHKSFVDCPEDERNAYVRRDCDIVEKAMSKLMLLHRTEDWGAWKYTLGAIAWQCFRHRFLDERILVHCDDEALAMERKAYYGGPATVFHQESFFEEIYHVDVNSLYPFVMRENRFPIRLYKGEQNISGTRLSEVLGHFGTCALCAINSEEYAYPIYDHNKVRFANGHFITNLAGPELEYAHRHGHLRKVIGISLYQLGRPFCRFVDELYSERLAAKLAGDLVKARMYKLLLNNLYGKFAQRGIKWKDDSRVIPPYAWGHFFEGSVDDKVPQACRAIGWHTQIKQPLTEGTESVPIISAYVTSYGRLFMWKAIGICGLNNVMYSDCDSLHINKAGLVRLRHAGLLDEDRLGHFKLEGTYSAVRYYGPKRYEADDMIVFAGRKKNARETSARSWKQDEIEEVQSVISRQPTGTIHYRTVEKSIAEPSFDGRLTPDGLILPPWIDQFS